MMFTRSLSVARDVATPRFATGPANRQSARLAAHQGQALVANKAEQAMIERMQTMRQDGATYRAIGAVTGHGPKSVQRILERVAR
jgi:hypothetical protein